jgi:hypothetical protein
MINRYESLETTQLDNGKSVYALKLFESIPKFNDDLYIITEEGDRLDLLAMEFYGDPRLWWIIVHANNLTTADIGVDAGVELRIPRDLEYINTLMQV